MTVRVIVKSKEGSEIWSFIAGNIAELKELSAMNGVEINPQTQASLSPEEYTSPVVLGEKEMSSQNLQALAAEEWIEIPVACGAGVCGICVCEVEKWEAMIDAGNPMMPLETDEKGNPKKVLTCVATIKPEYFTAAEEYTLILKRMY